MPPRKRAATKRTPPAKATAPRKTTPRKTAAPKPPAKRGPGRPRKLEIDPDLQTSIAAKVKVGAHPERAAVASGISERTHYLWQAKGLDERERRDNPKDGEKPRADHQVFLDYVDALDRAGAEAEIILLERAAKGGAGGSGALAILERRFRDRWGVKTTQAGPSRPATSATPATPLGQLEQKRAEREQAAR